LRPVSASKRTQNCAGDPQVRHLVPVCVLLCIPILIVSLALAAPLETFAASPNDAAQLTGDWKGDSTCQVRPSPCNDEKALYHLSPSPNHPGHSLMRVDSKPVTMGTLECSSDSKDGILINENSRGTWKFKVKGNTMEGTLTLASGVLSRWSSLLKESGAK
jgi:hypothetical protein